MNLTPSLKPPVRGAAWNRGRVLSRALRVDCGRHGVLAVAEIARLAGIDPDTVRKRMRAGMTGEALCAPRGRGEYRELHGACDPTILLAVKLAMHFHGRRPTIDAVMKVQPMSRQKARRYCIALRRAQGGAP